MGAWVCLLCSSTGIVMPGNKHIAAAAGEALAEALYDEHKEGLRSYVRERVPAAAVAEVEDIVQEAFARTIKHLKKGKPVKSPKAFLFTAARDVITSAARQQLDALGAAMSDLPDNYREAFVRCRIRGESCAEIAEAMGVEEHTAATYVARGWQLLAEYCEAHNIALEKLSELC